MSPKIEILLGAVMAGYLIGAIPFSFIFGKLAGVDIRKTGSRSVGATNALRSAGKVPGILSYAFDIGKGIAVVIASYFFFAKTIPDFPHYYTILVGTAAVVGHVFPVYLGFKGGKGIATSLGVVFVLAPSAAIGTLIAFSITLFATRKTVSLASTAGAIAFPICVLVLYSVDAFSPAYELFFNRKSDPGNFIALLVSGIVLSAFVISRHIPNYKRLLKGEENSFSHR